MKLQMHRWDPVRSPRAPGPSGGRALRTCPCLHAPGKPSFPPGPFSGPSRDPRPLVGSRRCTRRLLRALLPGEGDACGPRVESSASTVGAHGRPRPRGQAVRHRQAAPGREAGIERTLQTPWLLRPTAALRSRSAGSPRSLSRPRAACGQETRRARRWAPSVLGCELWSI